jgi:SAM-dependent methyltransferase
MISPKLSLEYEHWLALQRMRTLETYYEWSYELFESHMGRRILDAGCGVGNFTAIAEKTAEYVLAADLSPKNIQVLKDRFRKSSVVEIAQVDLETDKEFYRTKQIDTIVCLDLLEHVYDDLSLLKNFFTMIQTGGYLLVKVPAFRWLYGAIDIASGHYRRYVPKELREKAESAGWETVSVNYMNIAGIVPYWFKSRVLKKGVNFSRTFKAWQLKAVRSIVPALKIVDKMMGPPIGQSVILVARKPSTNNAVYPPVAWED